MSVHALGVLAALFAQGVLMMVAGSPDEADSAIQKISKAIQQKDQPSLNQLTGGGRIAKIDRNTSAGYTPISVIDLFNTLKGCELDHINNNIATWTCGTGCDDPLYTLRAESDSGSSVLILGGGSFWRPSCGPVAPPSPPPQTSSKVPTNG